MRAVFLALILASTPAIAQEPPAWFSESLLGLPPTPALDPALGRPIEVLDVGSGSELSALTAASRHFGSEFQV